MPSSLRCPEPTLHVNAESDFHALDSQTDEITISEVDKLVAPNPNPNNVTDILPDSGIFVSSAADIAGVPNVST